MATSRLNRLERLVARFRLAVCPRCGSERPGGVSPVPFIVLLGKPQYTTFGPPDRLCPQCGSKPHHEIHVETPLMRMDGEKRAADDCSATSA